MQSLRTGFHKSQLKKSLHATIEDSACHKENQRSHMQQLRPSEAQKKNLKKAATKYDSQQKSQILTGMLIPFIMVLVASAMSHRDGSQ